MSFDSSRFTSDPWNNFLGVVMQQGRVQLDSDWNEWLAEFAHRIQAATLDVVGQAGVPSTTPNAFLITLTTVSGQASVSIGAGRMYVDGILAENHGLPAPNPAKWIPASGVVSESQYPGWDGALDELAGPNAVDYNSQPYLPNTAKVAPFPQSGGPYLIYLDVWKREVTFLEDPDLIEKAVGVDTTGRLQIVWQVKWMSVPAGTTCSSDIPQWDLPPGPRLTTGVVQSNPSGPCCLTPNTGYTGLENQLYRVEIHQPGAFVPASVTPPLTPATIPAGTATFKWSRDNASVATGVTAITQGGTVLTVESTGKDSVLRFNPNDWVEVTDDWLELNGLPGVLCLVAGVSDSAKTITLTAAVSTTTFPVDSNGQTDPTRHTRVTRWDQGGQIYESDGKTLWVDLTAPGASGDIPVPPPGVALQLENGVTVSFNWIATGTPFETGYFWTFAARNSDGTVEYLDQAPPAGIYHHYAKLATLTFPGPPTSCRNVFPPLTGIEAGGGCCCCSVTVGDGLSSHGDYTDIQQAINSLSGATGPTEVCLLPGTYTPAATINITGNNLTIKGCPQASIQFSGVGAVFQVSGFYTTFDSLTVQAQSLVVQANLAIGMTIQNCTFTIKNANSGGFTVIAQSFGLSIQGSRLSGGGIWAMDGALTVSITNNDIYEAGAEGILLGGSAAGAKPSPTATGLFEVEISGNQIVTATLNGISATAGDNSGDVVYLEISENFISSCCQTAGNLPSAGIYLQDAQMVRIRDNEISYNGGQGVACYGIYTLDCIDVEISDNRMLDNGVAKAGKAPAGGQAGIYSIRGTQALRIFDNEVRMQTGPALWIEGRGPMSITRNNLSSFGGWSPGATGLVVRLYNVGVPLELKDVSMSVLEGAMSQVTPAASGDSELALVDGRTLFEGNQVSFVSTDLPRDAIACVFLSLDDLAIQNNQFEAAAPVGSVFLVDVYGLGFFTLRTIGNRFSEVPGGALLSHWGLGLFNMVTENQATNCILAQGTNTMPGNNQILVGAGVCSQLSAYLKRIIGGQATVGDTKVTNEAFSAVAEAARSLSSDATTAMSDIAASQSARSARLTAALTRLQQSPKTPADTITKLQASITASTSLAQGLSALAQRIQQRPTVDPADLAVFGQVLDATGAAAAGVYVRLTDTAGSLKAGSRVKTTATGDFSLVLKSCELPAGAADLLVAVEDANGARLGASGAITPKAGSPVYVRLTLSNPPAGTATPKSNAGPAPAPPAAK